MTPIPEPPRWTQWLLRRCLAPGRYEEVADDLEELFRHRMKTDGVQAARRWYVWDVLSIARRRSLRHERTPRFLFPYDQARGPIMWQNYLKIALRTLRRHPGTTFINVAGLAVGIACCVLIMLFVSDEWSYDRFHANADRIYRPWFDENYGENERFVNTVTPLRLAAALEEQFPEVEDAVRVGWFSSMVRRGDETFPEPIHLVDSTFFEVFSFELLRGDAATALDQPYSIVLTERLAQKYFTGNPMGQTLSMQIGDGYQDFTVTGIAADVPTASSIQFGALIPFRHSHAIYGEGMHQSWFQVVAETYVLLREGGTAEALEAKLPTLSEQILGDDYAPGRLTIGLQPLTAIHLDTSLPAGLEPTSDPAYSYILGAIALLVLLIACINFTTLAIGRSAGRALEVGVRKVVGAQRRQLMGQFWGEAVLLTLLALLVGIGLAWATLPLFNTLAGRSLVLMLDGSTLLFLAALVLIVGLLAGSYPAVVLSAFRPIEVLKGTLRLGHHRGVLQRGLTVVQFGLSIFLIIATLGMQQQLRFLQTKNLGFDREQVIVLPTNANRDSGMQLAERFRTALADEPQIAEVGGTYFVPGDGWAQGGYTDDHGIYREFMLNIVSPEFEEALELERVAGRGFSRDNPADLNRGLLVNEALVRAYGWEQPIGQRLPGPNFPDHEVIGVVKDFNYASLHTPVEPLVLAATPETIFEGIENIGFASSPSPEIIVRVQTDDFSAILALLEQTWAEVAPGQEFSFTFLDEMLDRQYRQEQRLGQIVSAAALLAILIACLGLFGLAALTAVRRTKEIGIRKVLGASVPHLSMLLTREFALLVGLAFVLAAPVAYLALQRWLNDFAYRIDLSAWLFLLAGGLALAIAVGTVSYQAIKTALVNPARVLRYE